MANAATGASVQIDTQQIKALGDTIIAENNELNSILMDISKTMNDINQMWHSPAGEQMATAFSKIKPDFEKSTKLINSYALFLRLVAETYEETETRIKQGASSFSD